MVTINRRLGNGFIFNAVDSSKDQEHYFYGAKKVVRASVVGSTAKADSSNVFIFGSGSGFRDIAVSSSGKIFVIGQQIVAGANKAWMVLSSSDSGATWIIVDLTGGAAGVTTNSAESIAISPAGGKIFVAGALSSSVLGGTLSGTCDFAIRSSSDGGNTWHPCFRMHTGSDPRYTGVDFATAVATHPTDASLVYAVGVSVSASTPQTPVWKTVKSDDGGNVWSLVDDYSDPLAAASSSAPMCAVVSSSGLILVGGGSITTNQNSGLGRSFVQFGSLGNSSKWVVRTSSDAGTTWGTVDYDSSGPGTTSAGCYGIHIAQNGTIFAVGMINALFTIKSSSMGGATGSWRTVFSSSILSGNAAAHDISSDLNNNLIAIGYALSSSATASIVMVQSRQGGTSGSWGFLDLVNFNHNTIADATGKAGPSIAAISVSGNQFYYAASSGSHNVASTVAGLSGTIGRIRSLIDVAGLISFSITGSEEVFLAQELRDSSNSVLGTGSFIQEYFGLNADTAQKKMNPYLTFKVSSSLSRFNSSDFTVEFRDENSSAWSAFKNLRLFGSFHSSSDGYMEYRSLLISGSRIQEPVVKFLTGSLLFKITTLLSSTIYTFKDFDLQFDQSIPDRGVEKYKTLENQNLIFRNVGYDVSEFSHAGGVFQMKNMIIGTVDSGRVGKDDNSIIQIRHRGSFVKVLWPKQDVNSFVKGYGDFSQGQKSGKLTTAFQPGEFIDVTQYDHLSLYCYLKKDVAGTLDDVVIRLERRALRDLPFTADQSITYEASGSATEAVLKDLLFVKSVNYADLSISEIGYPIDIPLENTRELRISCRHKNGQSAEGNKNFIVWGRLIKSDEET